MSDEMPGAPDFVTFARRVLERSEWPHANECEDIEDIAIECGLLVPEHRTTFCDVDCGFCPCADCVAEPEIGFDCYRKHPALMQGDT